MVSYVVCAVIAVVSSVCASSCWDGSGSCVLSAVYHGFGLRFVESGCAPC